MDVFFLMAFFSKLLEIKIVILSHYCQKNIFLSAYSCLGGTNFYVRWTKNLNMVEPLVMGTRTSSLYFVNPKFLDYLQY